jgi:hypothetical protein
MVSGASRGQDMHERPRRIIILLRVGLVLSAIAVLLGVGSLFLAFFAISDHPHTMDYMVAYTATGLGLVLLVPGVVGLLVCNRRLHGQSAMPPAFVQISPVPTADLPSLKARVAAGLCPRCGAHVAPTDQYCPTCRIGLAWA